MAIVIQLEEYEWLSFSRADSPVSANQFARLTSAWQAITGRQIGGAFEFGAGRARPTNWIGTMSAAGVRLEVVPRGASTLPPPARARLDSNVGDMLEVALSQETLLIGESASAPDAGRFERALEAFCELLARARRIRVLRGYRAREEATRAAHGSVRFPDQALLELARPGLVASRWVELDEDLPENRFLKAVLVRMRPRSVGRLRRLVDEALAELEATPASPDPFRDHELIRFERLPSAYIDAIALGRDLLEGRGLGLFAGSVGSRSEVVFMDALFQAFVTRLAATAARRHGWISAAEKPGRYLARWVAGPSKGQVAVELLPDVELSPSALQAPGVLIDAKWKVLEPARRGLGLSASDVHQMLAYGQRLKCAQGVLVYPWVGSQSPFGGEAPTLRMGIGSTTMSLRIVTVPLLWESVRQAQLDFEARIVDLLAATPPSAG